MRALATKNGEKVEVLVNRQPISSQHVSVVAEWWVEKGREHARAHITVPDVYRFAPPPHIAALINNAHLVVAQLVKARPKTPGQALDIVIKTISRAVGGIEPVLASEIDWHYDTIAVTIRFPVEHKNK